MRHRYGNRSSIAWITLALGLAACAASTAPSTPLTGDPPLTGIWAPVGADISPMCGVDTPCSLHLQLAGTAITGTFVVVVLPTSHENTVPLQGSFAPPAVHLQWGSGSNPTKFDGELQADTLLVGTVTPPNASLAFPVHLHRTE